MNCAGAKFPYYISMYLKLTKGPNMKEALQLITSLVVLWYLDNQIQVKKKKQRVWDIVEVWANWFLEALYSITKMKEYSLLLFKLSQNIKISICLDCRHLTLGWVKKGQEACTSAQNSDDAIGMPYLKI